MKTLDSLLRLGQLDRDRTPPYTTGNAPVFEGPPMWIWCQAAHKRFWRVERFVDAFGVIEYWQCTLCGRQWKAVLPPVKTTGGKSASPSL